MSTPTTKFSQVLDLSQFLQPSSHFPPDIQFCVTSSENGHTITLPAHKVFMAQASPIFKRQFYGGGYFQPTVETELNVPDVEPEVFKQFLDLIYGSRAISWTGSDKTELKNLLELLKLIDYHYHDGQDQPITIMKGLVFQVLEGIKISDDDTDDYIELADKYRFLEDAQEIVHRKAFQSKCMQQLCTAKFDSTLVTIVRDRNPRSRPKAINLMSRLERQEVARSLPQTESDLPSHLVRFKKPILEVTQYIQKEILKHTVVQKVKQKAEKEQEEKLIKVKGGLPPSQGSPVKVEKWHVVEGKWRITPAYAEMERKAKEAREKAEMAHRSNVVSVLKGEVDIIETPVMKCRGNVGPLMEFSVRNKADAAKEQHGALADLVKGQFTTDRGIIFTLSKKQAESLAAELRKMGVEAASLPEAKKGKVTNFSGTKQIVEQWNLGKVLVIVACPNSREFKELASISTNIITVKFVIHFSLPFSMQDYFDSISLLSQDTTTSSIMYWKLTDYMNVSQKKADCSENSTDSLYSLLSYCVDLDTCRCILLARHVQDTDIKERCGTRCDNCQNLRGTDMTKHARELLRMLRDAREKDVKVTGKQAVDHLMGKCLEELRLDGWEGGNLSREHGEALVAKMMVEKYVWERLVSNAYRTLSYLEATDREVTDTFRMKFRESISSAKVVRGKQGPGKLDVKPKKRMKVVEEDDLDEEDYFV